MTQGVALGWHVFAPLVLVAAAAWFHFQSDPGLDAELVASTEVLEVMSHDQAAARRQSQFENPIVIRSGEKWSPQEVNVLQVGMAGEIADKSASAFRRLARRQMLSTAEHVLPFGIEAHRKANLETR